MNEIRSTAIVILGASGDLTKRKLIPALHTLYQQGKIGDSCVIIGSGRTAFNEDSFRRSFDVSEAFAKRLFYHQYIPGLKRYIDSLGAFSRIVFFLSQPPVAYGPTAHELIGEGFGKESSIIIEKPFGYDFESARALNSALGSCFDESQIFRIDHYLAKEAVQNILVFRFANSLFYPVWNSRYIESIQISALENIGIIERGTYFDRAGIIRDMVQNHLLQLLCLLTMEIPVTLNATDIRDQKINVLRSIHIDNVYRYQYEGYQNERGVRSQSKTETYAELKLHINNFRWTGTPIYIRTGKATHRRGTEIGIRFKTLPHLLFNEKGLLSPNQIIIKIQPAEGIILDLSTKVPGTDDTITGTHMDFCYRDNFESQVPEAYQRLLYDALKGDHTLFVSAHETEVAWDRVKGILDKGDLNFYKKGTMPPSAFNFQWIDFDKYSHLCA